MSSLLCPMMVWALWLLFVTTTKGADISNVVLLLRNIAMVEDIDINMIGKFHQPPGKTVILNPTGIDFILILIIHLFQALKEMALLGIPVFVHDIGTQHNTLSNMPEEKCPVFNPHERSDLNRNGEVLVPHDELFMRQVLAS